MWWQFAVIAFSVITSAITHVALNNEMMEKLETLEREQGHDVNYKWYFRAVYMTRFSRKVLPSLTASSLFSLKSTWTKWCIYPRPNTGHGVHLFGHVQEYARIHDTYVAWYSNNFHVFWSDLGQSRPNRVITRKRSSSILVLGEDNHARENKRNSEVLCMLWLVQCVWLLWQSTHVPHYDGQYGWIWYVRLPWWSRVQWT